MRIKKIILIVIVGIAILTMSFVVQNPWEVPAKYKTMENPYADVEDEYEIGIDLYETHCASCHGDEGFGDGKKAESLETVMRDLTSDAVQEQTDGELYYKSIIGRDEMPNFEKKISDEEERWMLVNYLRMLAE